MKPVLVLYATREGQTRRIAEAVVASLKSRGVEGQAVDAAHIPEDFPLDGYSAVIVGASVHGGKHEREIRDFVKFHRAGLESLPAAFLSVSLSEAGAQDVSASPERRAQASADAKRMIETFLAQTGWRPARIKAVAGALAFTKYNFVLRFVMKQIARKAGGSVDTSKDQEYTDWTDLDRFVQDFILTIRAPAAA